MFTLFLTAAAASKLIMAADILIALSPYVRQLRSIWIQKRTDLDGGEINVRSSFSDTYG